VAVGIRAQIGVIALLRGLEGIVNHNAFGKFVIRALDLVQEEFVFVHGFFPFFDL
jgi:hypothetical protein